jgi:hypothetical protein
MTKISILFPSRGRSRKSHDTAVQWREQIGEGVDFELILSIDRSDPTGHLYKQYHRATAEKIVHEQNESSVQAINRAAEASVGDILIVVSDDTKCFPNWGHALLKEIEGKKDFILKTQDGIQPYIITFPILDRTYYNRFGYIYHPGYKHLFCDLELTCVGDITKHKLTSKLLFPHEHYSVTKQKPDETSRRADATWEQGEKLFLERYKNNFYLPKGGKIQDKGMIDYLINKQVYAK